MKQQLILIGSGCEIKWPDRLDPNIHYVGLDMATGEDESVCSESTWIDECITYTQILSKKEKSTIRLLLGYRKTKTT